MKSENLIKRFLLGCANQKRLATYTKTIEETKLPFNLGLSNDRKKMSIILEKISKEEHAKGLPLLSALVVSSTDYIPSAGFYSLAVSLGLISKNATVQEKKSFAQDQQLKCFRFWKLDEA